VVREGVRRIVLAPDNTPVPIPIRLQATAQKLGREVPHDRYLPYCEDNATRMLHTRTMLWNDRWPVLRVAADFGHRTDALRARRRGSRATALRGPASASDDVLLFPMEIDAQTVGRSASDDVPVTEIRT
jgi:hypothetical protein